MEDEIKKARKPRIKEVKLSGVSLKSVSKGNSCSVCQKLFITSVDANFHKIALSMTGLFSDSIFATDVTNRMLVVLKPNHSAKIYDNFPMCVKSRVNRSIDAGQLVFKNDIIDITNVEFRDNLSSVELEDGDRIVWLFRNGFHFGLYFDLSGNLSKDAISIELGTAYRNLYYLDVLSFLKNQSYFDLMLEEGWFPFIRLVGDLSKNLISYYEEEKENCFFIERILSECNKDLIESWVEGWWRNTHFEEKKPLIEAGISAYFESTQAGYINCIKNLLSEAEGLIRNACYAESGNTNPSTADLKRYITEKR